MVVIPVAVTLWSCAELRSRVIAPPDAASVVIPAAIVTVENPDDAVVSVAPLEKLIVVIAEPTELPACSKVLQIQYYLSLNHHHKMR